MAKSKKKKSKKLLSVQECSEFVNKTRQKAEAVIRDEVLTLDEEYRAVLMGRVINSLFCSFFNTLVVKANECLDEAENSK